MGGPAGCQELGSQWSLVRGVHGREWEKRMADAGSEFYKSECKDTGSRASPLSSGSYFHTQHIHARAHDARRVRGCTHALCTLRDRPGLRSHQFSL